MDESEETIKSLQEGHPSYTYTGTYFEAKDSPTEAILAKMCDDVFSYESKTYQYSSPIGALGNVTLFSGASWKEDAAGLTFDIQRMVAKGEAGDQFFCAYHAEPSDKILLDRTVEDSAYMDDMGAFPYGGYL